MRAESHIVLVLQVEAGVVDRENFLRIHIEGIIRFRILTVLLAGGGNTLPQISTHSIQDIEMPRLESGLKTPLSEYFLPILNVLRDGKSHRVEIVYDMVREQMPQLNAHDFEELNESSRPEPRWMHTMRVARYKLVQEGLLAPLSEAGHGRWRATERGISWLQEATRQAV